MHIALAQINSSLGDFDGNVQKILDFCEQAVEKKCQLIVFPELSVPGYHPGDLLEYPDMIHRQNEAIQKLVEEIPDSITCLVGAVTENPHEGKPCFNSALLIQKGMICKQFHKELLATYDVFDDSRYFASGRMVDNCFQLNGKNIQVLICEDMWGWSQFHKRNPIVDIHTNEVDLVISLNASPFTLNKMDQRLFFAMKTVEQLGVPLIYVNMVGGQDELIFDGSSFALNEKNQILTQSSFCKEDLGVVDFDQNEGSRHDKRNQHDEGTQRSFSRKTAEHLRCALVLGVRDYMEKVDFQKAHLGLSGGIDSAVALCLLADAIGPENVAAMALPTDFNSRESLELARSLAKNVGCSFHELPLQKSYEQLVQVYENCFGPREFSVVHENIQARLRGLFLMAYSNEHNSLLISTGNKSEYATGYITLYGDMCGGLAPLGDLLKSQIHELAQHYNQTKNLIPSSVITRPPSAELRWNQKDTDSLPEYDLLDSSVHRLVCQLQQTESKTDQWLLKKLHRSEFKRWQAPPILKISDRAFGRGWRMPIAHKMEDE